MFGYLNAAGAIPGTPFLAFLCPFLLFVFEAANFAFIHMGPL